jgi:hypothetical protein
MRRILQQPTARAALAAAVIVWAMTAVVRGDGRPIDTERSTLTVLVYKSGMFSAFADDHVIRAPIASGTISEEAPLAVSIEVKSASLKVLDPKLSADKRADVQARMLGPEVLDTAAHPDQVDRDCAGGRVAMDGHRRALDSRQDAAGQIRR